MSPRTPRRSVSAPAASFGLCLLYICLFPHLIAGPIVRYRDVAGQLLAREHSAARIYHDELQERLGIGYYEDESEAA